MIHRQGTVMGYAYELDLPQDARTLICLPAAPQETDVLRQAAPACALLIVHPNSWNDDLSPWPASRVFAHGTDFGGGAPVFLAALEQIVSEITPRGSAFDQRILCGYSMGGLFALWAGAHSRAFTRVGSVSGSLWFDGFSQAFAAWPVTHLNRAYLSVGARESRTRNPALSRIDACLDDAYNHLVQSGVPTLRQIHPGGHFDHPQQRLCRCIEYLSR